MRKWLLLVMAAIAGGAESAGKAEAVYVFTNDPVKQIFYLQRPCRLPLPNAAYMREFEMRGTYYFEAGCWGESMNDDEWIVLYKAGGRLHQMVNYRSFMKAGVMQPDGEIFFPTPRP